MANPGYQDWIGCLRFGLAVERVGDKGLGPASFASSVNKLSFKISQPWQLLLTQGMLYSKAPLSMAGPASQLNTFQPLAGFGGSFVCESNPTISASRLNLKCIKQTIQLVCVRKASQQEVNADDTRRSLVFVRVVRHPSRVRERRLLCGCS